ncbi:MULTISPECIES: SRPBCC family protein [Arthrobacter]|nr:MULTISPECIES: SRPBCC family protein [Arthrobacter]MBT8159732.1 SRPBCC family protein [Arthrobacter sp. GN70]
MVQYSFLTRWDLEGPIERVWDTIIDVDSYPQWWKYVAGVELVRPGDEAGIGVIHRVRWTTALPYSLTIETEVVRREPPHVLEVIARGELQGSGLWELTQADGTTTVIYRWKVSTTRTWMNLTSPVLRRAFARNHDVLMKAGGEGLAQRLGARITVNSTRDGRSPA